MNLRRHILFLFLLLAAAVRAADFDCRFLYSQTTPSAGPWLAKSGTLETETPEANYYLLGRGLAGGSVFRVVPTDPKAPTYLKKTYRSKRQRDQDATLLQVFGETYPNAKSPFRIPKVTPLGDFDLIISDTPGRDLHSLLIDNHISSELKDQLREAYQRKLHEFGVFLYRGPRISRTRYMESDREYFGDGKRDGTEMLDGWFGPDMQQIALLIKSDNIIVHWVGGDDPFVMTLIDPY